MRIFELCVHADGKTHRVSADSGKSIWESLRAEGFIVNAPCAGRGVCGKCRVLCKGLLRSLDGDTVQYVDGSVPSCRYAPAGDGEVWLSCERMRIAAGPAVKLRGGGEGKGLAVDLGTTTVAAAVYDLETGDCIRQIAAPNAQRACGADVISRMERCRRGELAELVGITKKQLAEFTAGERIDRVSLVGNTVMEHLAAGLDPSSIAVPPFAVQSLFGEETLSDIWDSKNTYFARCVSGYVGGDVLAGMLSCGLHNSETTQLYVDIGTNGEIAVGDKHGYTLCATAAGPAFEGATIECGMSAMPGAVDRVWTENGEICCHVIGETAAKGLCGSGLIDAAAVLLDLKLISKSGRLIPKEKAPENLRERFCIRSGVRAFLLCDEVYITLHDIHSVQLAKAAIRAGIETVSAGKTVERITVAGGFGQYMNIRSAVRIGLLPDGKNITQAGNAAAVGAALLLRDEARAELRELAEKCVYVDLSSSVEFARRYIELLNFE